MTYQSPRIYLYKITFEEVSYYYYGLHKEQKYNEEYWGSPVTHKWVWEFYTPKKQILEIFDYTDEGWLEANNIERRIIKPVLNDKLCLNENCGVVFSFETCSKAGKMGGAKTYELGVGMFSLTPEEKSELGKRNGIKLYEENKGIFSLTYEQRKELGKKIYEKGVGIHARTREEIQEQARKNGKKVYEEGKGMFSIPPEERSEITRKTNNQKWMCLETGFVTGAGPLSNYQRAKGIDISKRKRIS
jgi:general stress protein YciG